MYGIWDVWDFSGWYEVLGSKITFFRQKIENKNLLHLWKFFYYICGKNFITFVDFFCYICGISFYYICGQFLLHLWNLLHLWTKFCYICGIYYICGICYICDLNNTLRGRIRQVRTNSILKKWEFEIRT